MLHLGNSIYQINNWSELFAEYEQLTLNKPCQTCWSDKVKVFNYFNKMAKKTEPNEGEKTYKFKAGFEDTEIHLAGRMSPIKSEDLNENISLILDIPTLMELVELV
jgi:hypothetical protein